MVTRSGKAAQTRARRSTAKARKTKGESAENGDHGTKDRVKDIVVPQSSTPCTRFYTGRDRVLRLLASGAHLRKVLDELVLLAEGEASDMLCSILRFDESSGRLYHASAPNLPKDYNSAVDGIAMGPTSGSCGTAAFRRERVVVEDTLHDPLWAAYRDLAREHNLRACWSQPFFSSTGRLLGTFAVYYHEPRSPQPVELSLIEAAAALASIAIELKQTEESLKSSEDRFRRLAEQVRVIPWEADADSWQFLYVGPQAQNVLGFPPADWHRKGFWLAHVHPEDRGWVAQYCAANSTTKSDFEFEYRMIAHDGRVVWLHDIVNVVHYAGEPRVLRGFMVDITARKLAEESARRADRLASLGTLAAGIAHEINNPLGAILLTAQRGLAHSARGAGNDQTCEILGDIMRCAERCGRIVASVLQFARVGSSNRLPCDINALVRRADELTRAYAHQREAVVRYDLAEKLPQIHVNPVEMEQVVVNLLNNAIESRDGVLVSVRTQPAADKVELAVTDNGRGMTAEQRSHIFDPFFTTRGREGGTGLGLSITHGIVASHGGKISVRSRTGKGTKMVVSLPPAAPPLRSGDS